MSSPAETTPFEISSARNPSRAAIRSVNATTGCSRADQMGDNHTMEFECRVVSHIHFPGV